jgi:hypothetical protein
LTGLTLDEGIRLGGRRRQAGEVEIDAADERVAICFGRRLQTFSGETFANEAVDGMCLSFRFQV